MGSFKDLTGNKYGRLTVSKFSHKDKFGKSMWECCCDCGNSVIVESYNLTSSHTQSCGCIRNEKTSVGTNRKHGMYGTRIYNIWATIIQRCENPNHIKYPVYGGRGIKICDSWRKDFMSFYNWSINNGYSDNLTIDRIDVNGNYEPSNCRWTDYKTQENNKTNNRLVTINNSTKTFAEWCRIYKIHYSTAQMRLKYGWSEIDAITKPIK